MGSLVPLRVHCAQFESNTGEYSALNYSYRASKQRQLRLNMVLEREQRLHSPTSIIVEEEGRGEKKTGDRREESYHNCPSWFGEALIWPGSVPPLLLAASHAEQCLAGSEEVRSCESWEAVKYQLGSKWQIHHWRSDIHHLKAIDVLLGQKEIAKGEKGRHGEGEIFHLSLDCSFYTEGEVRTM